MEIVKADRQKLLEVLYIIKECSQQLLEKGVKYWNNSLTDYNEIATDIDQGFVYIIYKNKVAVGTITLKPNETESNLTISRLAIHPAFQKKGLAHQLLSFAMEITKSNNYRTVSGDIPLNDKLLINLLEENGFENKGTPPDNKEEYVRINFERKL